MLFPLLLGTLVSVAHTPNDTLAARTDTTSRRLVADSAAAPLLADRILLEKSRRRLTLIRNGVPVRTYQVALGQNPVGDKQRRGDMRTPEGTYRIEARVEQSRFHLALRISYPDAAHRARAAAIGKSPGGDIEIHGLPRGFEDVGEYHTD